MDPEVKTYLAANTRAPITLYVRLDSQKLSFYQAQTVHEKEAARAELYKKEVGELLAELKDKKIESYLQAIGMVELTLSRSALKKLITLPHIMGIVHKEQYVRKPLPDSNKLGATATKVPAKKVIAKPKPSAPKAIENTAPTTTPKSKKSSKP